MEQDVWQEIEQLYQTFQELGINESVDYDKYYLYSLITHSTAIEGSTLTKLSKGETVSMEVLMKICKALECNIGDIMDLIPEEETSNE